MGEYADIEIEREIVNSFRSSNYHGQKNVLCLCGKRFAHKGALIQHMKSGTCSEKTTCKICKKVFRTKISMEQHFLACFTKHKQL
jgi:uncharacterized Zn-finger protein